MINFNINFYKLVHYFLFSDDEVSVITLADINASRPKREIVSKLLEQALITELVIFLTIIVA